MSEWKQPKLRNSLRKYGYDAHKVEIVLQYTAVKREVEEEYQLSHDMCVHNNI